MDVDDRLTVTRARGEARSVAVLLHGGRDSSNSPTGPGQAAVVRLTLIDHHLRRTVGENVTVLRLRNAVRGWNDGAPVDDAMSALDHAVTLHPGLPIVLVGHSMGARIALAVAGHEQVVRLVGLAPWLPPADGIGTLAGRDLLIVHGDRDRVIRPSASLDAAQRAHAAGVPVARISLAGDGHSLMRHPATVHRLVADAVTAPVVGAATGGWADAVAAGVHGDFAATVAA